MPVFLAVESEQRDRARLRERYDQHGVVLMFEAPVLAMNVLDELKYDYVVLTQRRLQDPEYLALIEAVRSRFVSNEVPLLYVESIKT